MLQSIIATCHDDRTNCVSNSLVSIVFYILIVAWFGLIATFGFAAQERRKRWILFTLIFMEISVIFVAYINAKGHMKPFDPLNLLISTIDIILAGWIIYLCIRILKGGTGRVVSKQRPRRRRVNADNK